MLDPDDPGPAAGRPALGAQVAAEVDAHPGRAGGPQLLDHQVGGVALADPAHEAERLRGDGHGRAGEGVEAADLAVGPEPAPAPFQLLDAVAGHLEQPRRAVDEHVGVAALARKRRSAGATSVVMAPQLPWLLVMA